MTLGKNRFLAILLVLVWGWMARPFSAFADEASDYAEAIRLGVAEFDTRNFAEARAHFSHAHAIQPSARTLRGLGMVEFELKNYRDCLAYLEGALSSSVRPLDAVLLDETRKLRDRARGYVARIAFTLEPASATAAVDGLPAALGKDGSLLLEVGDHVLEFVAPGRMAEKRRLKVNGGEDIRLRIALQIHDAQTQPAKPQTIRPLYKNPWLWTAVGLVVVGAGAGTAVALSRQSSQGTAPAYAGNSGAPVLVAP